MTTQIHHQVIERRAASPVSRAGVRLLSFWAFCRRKPLGGISALIILILLIMGVFANYITPNSPSAFLAAPFAPAGYHPPDGQIMLLGGDDIGRDVFSRLVYGARISLLVGVFSVGMGLIVGAALGLVSAYYGGLLDLIVQRFVDGVMAFPALVLALTIVTLMGKGFAIGGAQANVVLSIAIVLIPVTVRVVRGAALSAKENIYVDAARSLGASDMRIIMRHVLPNVTHVIIIIGATYLGAAILLESTLSFLRQGTAIGQPSWGNMLATSRSTLESHQALLWPPTIAVSLAILAFNLLGDALRDVWDPRLRNT